MTLQEAERATRDAAIAGGLALFISLMLTLIYLSGGTFAALDPWNVIEIVALAALPYGVWRKSRVSAVALLVFYIGSKIGLWVNESAIIGLPIALIFGYFFWRGVRGAFAYHRLQTAQPALAG